MAVSSDFPAVRSALLRRLFPHDAPLLWCPPLTFIGEAGRIDRRRERAHLAFMAPHVRGYLVPGSTGDAWEMTNAEALEALDIAIPFAVERELFLLAGALRPSAGETRALIDGIVGHLCRRAGTSSVARAFAEARVCGVTIAAPSSPEPLSQQEIGVALEQLLALGLPTALYQLPQVTGNRMSPALVADLARRFPNFIVFKDSGGADEVALAKETPDDVTLLRGAEGDYARWSRLNGGVYDGFLLSTVNAFPSQLASVLDLLRQGRVAEAERLSDAVSAVVADAFAAVADLPQGNAFTNANKALAHIMAFGKTWRNSPPPRLHAGGSLPVSALEAAADSLERHDLFPKLGYLSGELG